MVVCVKMDPVNLFRGLKAYFECPFLILNTYAECWLNKNNEDFIHIVMLCLWGLRRQINEI